MKWINWNEKKPDYDETVLLLTDEGIVEGYLTKPLDQREPSEWDVQVLWLDLHGCGCCGGGYPNVTHWAKYPKLPKGVEK